MCKPVCGTCNLDCRYCYYTAKPSELYPGVKKFMMTEEILESYTRQYIEAQPEHCVFGWQGGEPLLAGKAFFRKAVEFQNTYAADGQTKANALQTNGTLLDDEWCEFLAANEFLVGISLDGPPQWHDHFRVDHAGKGSHHRAWKGVELLRKHNVEYNVLVTLNSTNAPHAGDIYRYFTNRGVNYVQFIPILERTADDEPTDFSCTGEQFGRFMLDVFDLWASRDIGRVSERFIDNVLHTLIYGKASMCCYSERCANAHILEWNGDFYVCDHFVYKDWKLGNIMQTPMSQLIKSPRLQQFAALKTEIPATCRDCEYFDLCRGGCPKHHRPIGTDPARWNHYCEGYKMFFREALPDLQRMAQYFKRGQTPPLRPSKTGGHAPTKEAAATREQFIAGPAAGAPTGGGPKQDALAAGAPGAGKPKRNAPCPCGSGRKYKACCGR